jgi:hypothetical protein
MARRTAIEEHEVEKVGNNLRFDFQIQRGLAGQGWGKIHFKHLSTMSDSLEANEHHVRFTSSKRAPCQIHFKQTSTMSKVRSIV